MDDNIKNAFANISMPQTCAEAIEASLQTKTVRLTYRRRSRPLAIVAVILAVALTTCCTAVVVQEVTKKRLNPFGTYFDEDTPPVSVQDGRLIFTFGNDVIDITDEISPTEPFIYTFLELGENDTPGDLHSIIVGGTVESYGFAEYIRQNRYAERPDQYVFLHMTTKVIRDGVKFFYLMKDNDNIVDRYIAQPSPAGSDPQAPSTAPIWVEHDYEGGGTGLAWHRFVETDAYISWFGGYAVDCQDENGKAYDWYKTAHDWLNLPNSYTGAYIRYDIVEEN